LAITRKLNHPRAIAANIGNLGLVALHLSELEQATGHLTEALETFNRLDDRDGVCMSLENLGVVDLLSDRVAQAHIRFTESLRIAVEIRYALVTTYSLVGLAAVAARGRDLAKAARLIGAADGLLERTGNSLETFELQLFDEVEQALTDAHDPTLEAARAETRLWTEAETVAYTLEERSPHY
jgi:hypothetical protein